MGSPNLTKVPATASGPPAPRPNYFAQKVTDPAWWAEWAALVGLIGLVIAFAILNPVFLTGGNIRSILVAASILVILAVGQTFVIATGGIDLSIASILTLSAVVLGQAYLVGTGLWVAMLLGVGTGLLLGLVNGLIIAKGGITDFIVTLGGLSAASGLALILADGKPVTIVDPFLLRLTSGSIGIIGYPVIVALVVVVVAHIVLFHTRFGTYVLATGGNREAAEATGIRTWKIRTWVYVIAGLLAGLACILLVARVGAAEPAANTAFLLNSVAAVVLGGVSLTGGRATIISPVIGALLLTVLVNGLTLMGISQFYQPLSVGVVVVLAAFLTRFQK